MPFIVAGFTQFGVPQEGLSPTVDVRRVSDGLSVISAEAMTHIGEGNYRYDFDAGAGFVEGVDYSFRSDGGAVLSAADRYVLGSSSDTKEGIADSVWSEIIAPHTGTSGTAAREFLVIKGLLLGNYTLDGGAGFPEVQRDAVGFASTSRLRIWDISANVPSIGGGTETTGLLADVVLSGAAHSQFPNFTGFVKALLTQT